MRTYINNIKKTLQSIQMKVVEVTKTNYTLENGDALIVVINMIEI